MTISMSCVFIPIGLFCENLNSVNRSGRQPVWRILTN